MTRWALAGVLTVAAGLILTALAVPAEWILAGILGAGVVASATGRELVVNEHVYRLCRAVIGVIAALPLVRVEASQFLPLLPAGLFVAAVTVGIGLAGGHLLHRWHRDISLPSAVLSMLAGGASVMPAIATELKADVRFVVLGQYLRLLVVSVTLPLAAALLATPTSAATAEAAAQPWWALVILALIVVLGDPVGRCLRIPVPSVFAPLLLTVAASAAFDVSLAPPAPLRTAAFVTIGWVCGGALSVSALRSFARHLPAIVAFIAAVMAACAATAGVLTAWLGMSYFEAYLATTPGALETVLALGAEGGAGPGVVVIQLIRLIAVLMIAAWLPRILRRPG
ncbi:AbrB family transcriptional regulator [Corynebacterium uterequi]|uniref:Putative ammonia monooxygenase n=1 Tax=Corynebacterium uterequi TaxID=1072256 RepID=A0A0G3HBM7_9CORY|nr:AbrB family transcriptional regulator [Corynebacterium uterequi]AKK10100.1 putative ammonia monooxygenase [Corynebacterium uterequi]